MCAKLCRAYEVYTFQRLNGSRSVRSEKDDTSKGLQHKEHPCRANQGGDLHKQKQEGWLRGNRGLKTSKGRNLKIKKPQNLKTLKVR